MRRCHVLVKSFLHLFFSLFCHSQLLKNTIPQADPNHKQLAHLDPSPAGLSVVLRAHIAPDTMN